MKLVVLPPFSVFAGNVYVRHGGAEYLGHPNFRNEVLSSLKVSSYPMPLSSAMAVASRLKSSQLFISNHTISFDLKTLDVL